MSSGASPTPTAPSLGDIGAIPATFRATPSGLVVPIHVLARATGRKDDTAAVDPDGRRRVVIPGDELKPIRRAIRVLEAHGFAIVLRCNDTRTQQLVGVPTPCGEVLQVEDADTHDLGFGCRCSRIHKGR
jgi:hypothetical protein